MLRAALFVRWVRPDQVVVFARLHEARVHKDWVFSESFLNLLIGEIVITLPQMIRVGDEGLLIFKVVFDRAQPVGDIAMKMFRKVSLVKLKLLCIELFHFCHSIPALFVAN